MERIREIAKIAGITIDSDIDFIASWNLKESNELTNRGRKYLGKMIYQEKETYIYYIAKDKQIGYITQVINDIQKMTADKNVIIFMENLELLSKNQKYVFGKESTVVIKYTNRNLQILKELINLEIYETIKKIYNNREILLSNWGKANYMTEDKDYIILMPFIDTEKLNRIDTFLQNNNQKQADIICSADIKPIICREIPSANYININLKILLFSTYFFVSTFSL